MNLRLATTWLLATTALMPSTASASAAGVRGKDKHQRRRVLQELQPATYLVQEIQNEVFRKLDNVELSNNLIYKVEGFMPPWWERSGQDIFLPPATIIDDETATITLPYPFEGISRLLEGKGKGDTIPKVESTLTEDQERNLSELHRTGRKRTVLAVKVVLSNIAYEFEDSYLECKVFGTSNGVDCDDTYHLTNAYSDCSYGKLQLGKADPRTDSDISTVSDISNGVVTVTLPNYSAFADDGVVRNEVTTALLEAFGTANGLADHLMYCLPPFTMGSDAAYAFVDHWMSVYNNQW